MKKLALCAAILTALTTPAMAAESSESPWKLNLGVAQVNPNDDSGTILGGGVGVDSATGLGISLTYKYDQNWGIEVLGALPFTHDIVGTGALSGVNIGETKHLPPTVSVIYEFGQETRYHFGLGVNYTKFFEEKADADLNAALGTNAGLALDASTGLALKAGFDTPLTGDWMFSGSLYYIDIDTTADVIVNDAVAASVDVTIDPVVLMLGISTRF